MNSADLNSQQKGSSEVSEEKPNSEERWRPVLGFEGKYEVSDRGRVRSIDHWVQTARYRALRKGRVLAVGTDPYGYEHVILGHNTTRKVHRLVLEAFVGPRPDGMHGCHNNGNCKDNRLENLRWDTRSANAFDSVRHGTHPMSRKTHCKYGHEFTPDNTLAGPRGRLCKACTLRKHPGWGTRKAASA